jgi:hypothetical protein
MGGQTFQEIFVNCHCGKASTLRKMRVSEIHDRHEDQDEQSQEADGVNNPPTPLPG